MSSAKDSLLLSYMIQARRAKIKLSLLKKGNADLLNTAKIFVDEHKLAQVVRNLVSNGLKFTPANGMVTITMSLFQKQNGERSVYHLRLDVKDTGAGISEVWCNDDVVKICLSDGNCNRRTRRSCLNKSSSSIPASCRRAADRVWDCTVRVFIG
jgi:sensor histidine kinase regulating citrate/malate metabolism